MNTQNTHYYHVNSALIRKCLAVITLIIVLLCLPVKGFGADVTLAWDANSESDLLGYIVYWGIASGSYSHSQNVGNITQYTISGLQEGVTYYFAATAYDIDNYESGYSQELVHQVPLPVDSDGDNVPDAQDAFPFDPNESLDTDGDGVGNNADTDDDNDGMPDSWELLYGLDPLTDDSAGDPDGDEVTNIDEYNLGTIPNHNEGNFNPDTPVLVSPDDGTTLGLTPLLEAEEFYDPNINDVHLKSQWKILRAFDDVCVFDVTTTGSLTSLTVPKQILAENTAYLWQVRFIDNHDTPSDWSEEREFTTDFVANDTNMNGVPDEQEVSDTLDLDQDGTPDYDQSDTKCVSVEAGADQICISIRDAANAVSIVSVEAEDPYDPQLSDKTEGKPNFIEFGLLNFKLLVNAPGAETVITIYLSNPVNEGGNCFKFDAVDGVWLDYSDYSDFRADRKAVYLTLKDGGFGDADGVENGIIVDPLAIGSNSNPNGGSNSSDSPIDEFFGGLGCFVSSAAADPTDKDRRTWSLWREIRGRETAIIFAIVFITYLVKAVFTRVRRTKGLIRIRKADLEGN